MSETEKLALECLKIKLETEQLEITRNTEMWKTLGEFGPMIMQALQEFMKQQSPIQP